MKTKSIKRKILFGMAGLSISISILCGVVSGIILYQTSNESMVTLVDESAAAYGSSVQKSIDNFKLKANAIAQLARITDSNTTTEEKSALYATLAKQYNFVTVDVSDSSGLTNSGADISSRDYFKAALEGSTTMSSTLTSKLTGEVIMIVATKINNGSDFQGVLICQLASDTFSQMIDDVHVGEKGYGFIVDKTGIIIAHKNIDNVTNFVNYIDKAKEDSAYEQVANVIKSMTAGETGTQTVTFEGTTQCFGYTSVPDTDGWSIGLSANKAEMMAGYYQGLMFTIILAFVFAMISCVFAFFIANPIAKPLVALVGRIDLLSEGDLHTEVVIIDNKNEIGMLSKSFSGTVDTLSSYVSDISHILTSLADGDFTVSSQQDYRGDFAPIKTAINTIIGKLSRVFNEIDLTADQVASGSHQVASGAQMLAQGATEQASATEELSATIKELASEINNTASNATKAKQYSEDASGEVVQGNKQMQLMLEAMAEISQSSEKISKINSTIEDIAFQTNILALNASVEAARAGTAGKGFAVVAEEVRNLASKSAAASQSTTALIENSLRTIKNGTQIADKTANSLGVIIESVKKSSDLIGMIADASNEQAAAINQITIGVQQISTVVQMNSATSEESAATSEELSGQAQSMKQALAFLKLNKQ